MRAWIAAVVGALAGAAAALAVVALRPETPAASLTDTSSLTREIAALRARIDRMQRAAAARPRVAAAPSSDGGDAPGTSVGGRGGPSAGDGTRVDLSKVSSEDLALEADDRHARDFDISGAAKRYRELLSRAATPAERRHWSIRLGDCYVRLQRHDEAMEAYRACVDASTEDHAERVACMQALARDARASDLGAARRWIDRALDLDTGRADRTVHELCCDLARDADDAAVESRELDWLLANSPGLFERTQWKARLAELRGEKR
jgi:tetratricopeptide (TPR) repeat protein